MKKVLLAVVGLVFIVIACTHKTYAPADITPIIVSPHDTTSVDTTAYVQDTSVCFQRDILPIFTGSCAKAGCHDAASAKKGYILISYSTIISVGLVKYSALDSKLYTECTSGKMPESPTPKLDSTQLSLISRWINMGAPDDTDCAVICDTNYTYSGGVKPILQKYCYGCHATAAAASSGGGNILDTYNGVLTPAQNGKLSGDLNHSAGFNQMPLGSPALPSCMVEQIKKWIDAGSLNN